MSVFDKFQIYIRNGLLLMWELTILRVFINHNFCNSCYFTVLKPVVVIRTTPHLNAAKCTYTYLSPTTLWNAETTEYKRYNSREQTNYKVHPRIVQTISSHAPSLGDIDLNRLQERLTSTSTPPLPPTNF